MQSHIDHFMSHLRYEMHNSIMQKIKPREIVADATTTAATANPPSDLGSAWQRQARHIAIIYKLEGHTNF